MTNAQVVLTLNMIEGLKKDKRHLPVKVSYAINKNQNILADLYKPYEETLKGLDEDDKQAIVDLLNEDNDVTLHKVTLADLEGADLSINEMEIIQTFMLSE